MAKKIPFRRCVVTKQSFPKNELTRVVCDNEGNVSVDLTSKANGRGAYIKLSKEVLENKKLKSSLSSSLKCQVSDSLIQELERILDEQCS